MYYLAPWEKDHTPHVSACDGTPGTDPWRGVTTLVKKNL